MERPAGMAWIEQNALTIGQIIRQAPRQVLMSDRRRRDDDQIDALHHWRQMRAHEKRRGFSARATFDQFDGTNLGQFGNCRFGAREQPYFEPAQGKIGGSGAPAVAGAQNRNFMHAHEIISRWPERGGYGSVYGRSILRSCISRDSVVLQLVFIEL